MSGWAWWLGGPALAAVVLLHWGLLQRQMAVSGRFTAIVNRIRFGTADTASADPSRGELIAALREATSQEFGEGALQSAPPASPASEAPKSPSSITMHLLFLFGLSCGGALSGATSDPVGFLAAPIRSSLLAQLTGGQTWLSSLWLLCGGVLVGFGTRMASGCTSGHGLCGVSRLQPASLLATVCFFGSGVLFSILLG